MAELWDELTEKLGSLAGKWTAYAAFGSFLLYLFGYLTLRFQLSTFGVATNLDVFDEKYLFAGCRFLVFLITTVPSILILVLVLAAIVYVPYKLIPVTVRDRAKGWMADWCAQPVRLPLLGVVMATALIQFVMRRCAVFGDLLLRKDLPDEWISSILLTSEGKLSLYFAGLVAGTLLTGVILLYVLSRGTATTVAAKFLVGVLIFLVAVEALLLPVNYGVLVSTQPLPRAAQALGADNPQNGETYWLVSDSKDAVTYFVRDSSDERSLVTVPKKDPGVKIVAYDDIFCILFSGNHSDSRPCPKGESR
jgi:hypothetical protein